MAGHGVLVTPFIEQFHGFVKCSSYQITVHCTVLRVIVAHQKIHLPQSPNQHAHNVNCGAPQLAGFGCWGHPLVTGDAELRLIHSVDHNLEDVAISCVPNLYTWNPNDPCFHWKRPGLLVPGICKYCTYIYIYTYESHGSYQIHASSTW